MKDNTLYLEADEDITSAIDKLQKTPADSVQIVVPKRSTMLQSIINLKLLKKAAEGSSKELVLVTNDKLATELAARVGLAVAPSLGAKAVLGQAATPASLRNTEEIIEADDPEPAASAPEVVRPAVAPPKPKRPLLKRRKVGDGLPVPPPAPEAPETSQAAAEPVASGAKKAPKVPDFNRLQRRLLWLGLAAFLVIGYLAGMYFFTGANVTLYANGTKVNIDTSFAVDPNLKSTDTGKAVLAGQLVTVSKDLTGAVTPTGKKDVGTKASGMVTFQNCEDSNVYPLSKGNVLSAQGLNFVTEESIEIPAGSFSNGGKNCNSSTVSVKVTAVQNGDSYNLTSATFTTPKLTSNFKMTGSLTGGTSKTVTVVTQGDVDTAKTALLEKDKDNIARDLKGRVPSGYIQMDSSESTKVESVTSAPEVGSEATTATLIVKVTYTALAASKNDFHDLVRAQELKQIGSQNQIYDDGLDSAQVTAGDKDATGRQTFHLAAEAYGGAQLDTAEIAKQLKGKRYGDAASTATGLPGVTRADISLKPAWATGLPSRADKIKVNIQVAGVK